MSRFLPLTIWVLIFSQAVAASDKWCPSFLNFGNSTARKIIREENRLWRDFDPNQKISPQVEETNIDLPLLAQKKISQIRMVLDKARFDRPRIYKMNIHTLLETPLIFSSSFPRDPLMAKGLSRAFIDLYNKPKLAAYIEGLLAETFRTMLNSGNADLAEKAKDGQIDHEVIVNVLKKRTAARGLEVAVIPSGAGVVSFDFILSLFKKGPIIDEGFIGASDPFNAHHGVYSHLFQFDYIAPTLEEFSQGKNIRPYIDFFGTAQGVGFWVEAFDVYGGELGELTLSRSLRDTYFFNNLLFGYDLLNLKHPSEYESAARLESESRGNPLTRAYHLRRPITAGKPPKEN